MPGVPLLVVVALLILGGTALAVVGVLGWYRRLPRNRFAGVRTANTLRGDEAFAVANRVGAPLSAAGGAIAVLGGIAVLGAPSTPTGWTLAALAALGALGLTMSGGVLGDRAASRVVAPAATGCGGACPGCSIVEGCADQAN